MTKYARPVSDGEASRMVDMFDTDSYFPKPDWWGSDEDALERIFQFHAAEWKESGEWFVQVPAGVEPYAQHTGSDYADPMSYKNPDNTYGDGSPIPPPPED